MRILLLGGTSDARRLAYRLIDEGHTVELRTLTAYGKALASDAHCVAGGEKLGDLEVEAGALDEALLTTRAEACDALVDATHPHAAQISALAMSVCSRLRRPFLRFERPEAPVVSEALVHPVTSHDAAARRASELVGEQGVVLLTTGSRNLKNYTAVPLPSGSKWVARVLPDADSLAACGEAGLSPAQVVAMQGPISEELERAFLRHFGCRVLVTKESGTVGGTAEKMAAARAEGVAVVVVARPRLAYPWATGETDAVVHRLREISVSDAAKIPECEARNPEEAPLEERGQCHIYTGDGKGKTTAAVGLAARAAGAGKKVAFFQFLKGGDESAELASLRKLGVDVVRLAKNPTGILRGKLTEADHTEAQATLAEARHALASGAWDLVVLDELHGALRHGLVGENDVLEAFAARATRTDVVSTGRHASEALRAAADLVTEMRCEKHYFAKGVRSRRGIEF